MSPIYTYLHYYPGKAWTTILILGMVSYVSYRILKAAYSRGRIEKLQAKAALLLIAYSLILIYLTFLGRRPMDSYGTNFNLGYSYRKAFWEGNVEIRKEIMENILLFLPIGGLGVMARKRFRFPVTMTYGILLSAAVEYFQLHLHRGLCEYDDILSNTMGTLIGSLLALTIIGIRCNQKERHAVVNGKKSDILH